MEEVRHGDTDGERDPADESRPAPPGWYADPITPAHHRFWDGTAWTANVFPDGPGGRNDSPDAGLATEPPANDEAPSDPEASSRRRRRRWRALAVPVVVAAAIGSSTAVAVNASNTAPSVHSDAPSPGAVASAAVTHPSRSTPELNLDAATTDPDASALRDLVLHQLDVPATTVIELWPGGTKVAGQATLDLCNGTFASEALRTARLQIAALDSQHNPVMSTEAVLYRNTAATQQAFSELMSTVKSCPTTMVKSPVGEQPVITRFSAPPDKSWGQVASVSRLAYAFTTTDQQGNKQNSIAVYLRRGRVLEGLYFGLGTTRPPIAGQTTVAGIVKVFSERMAHLPSSVVNSK